VLQDLSPGDLLEQPPERGFVLEVKLAVRGAAEEGFEDGLHNIFRVLATPKVLVHLSLDQPAQPLAKCVIQLDRSRLGAVNQSPLEILFVLPAHLAIAKLLDKRQTAAPPSSRPDCDPV
jgi:hypothetical protein